MARIEYFPILKAKQGELNALTNWPDADDRITPILEVIPWERDDEWADDADEIRKVVQRIVKAWGNKRGPLYVDAASAEPDQEDWANVVTVLGQILDLARREQVSVFPVVRASAAPGYLRALAPAINAWAPDRVLIRITAEDLDDTFTPLRDLVIRASDAIGVNPAAIDVVMDFGAVSDESASTLAARLARFVLPQLDEGPWRALAISGGAFPENLGDVIAHTVGRLPRHDLALWRSVNQLNLRRQIHFSDYAVTHPILPVGAAFAAPPQLRYTLGDEWLVSKGRRNDRRGHSQFYDICSEILRAAGTDAAPSGASWGDLYIHEAAEAANGQVAANPRGTGNASTWRAVATSHHLALVTRQLAEQVDL